MRNERWTHGRPTGSDVDWIERALREDEVLQPSDGFSAAVMVEVRRAAEAPPPLPFPWRRLLTTGLVALLGAVLAGLSALGLLPTPGETLEAMAGDAALAVLLARLATVVVITWLASSLPRWLVS